MTDSYYNLSIPELTLASPLMDLILELEHLRRRELRGSTPPHMFFQLKEIFHFLESLGSARIEGNRTTISEFIETKIVQEDEVSEGILEIRNMEKAMDFIEHNVKESRIDRAFISELHKTVVNSLIREGDTTPGLYRKHNVNITGSSHHPPEHIKVGEYMQELIDFINRPDPGKFDLLKTAIAHHRFAWIHPFGNGNGRTVRLLTYAMLVKQGFNLEKGRIVNPTAIFCSNRTKYYEMLSKADSGQPQDIISWCTYVLAGLKQEIEKIDKLIDFTFLKDVILKPGIEYSFQNSFISQKEKEVLFIAAERDTFMAKDIKHLFPGKIHVEVSRQLKKIKDRKLITSPMIKNSKKYSINFSSSFLLRGVMKMLDVNSFLPIKDEV